MPTSLGLFNAIAASTTACVVLLFSLLVVRNLVGFFVFAVLWGLVSGASGLSYIFWGYLMHRSPSRLSSHDFLGGIASDVWGHWHSNGGCVRFFRSVIIDRWFAFPHSENMWHYSYCRSVWFVSVYSHLRNIRREPIFFSHGMLVYISLITSTVLVGLTWICDRSNCIANGQVLMYSFSQFECFLNLSKSVNCVNMHFCRIERVVRQSPCSKY